MARSMILITHNTDEFDGCRGCRPRIGNHKHHVREGSHSGILGMEIDLPDVAAEVRAAFARYERALVANDVETLDALSATIPDDPFRRHREPVRLPGDHGVSAARSPVGLARTLGKTVITAYGRTYCGRLDLFYRETLPGKVGRQIADLVVRFRKGGASSPPM